MPTLNDVMIEFARRHAMPPPNVDETTGGYALAIDGRYIIHLCELGGNVAALAWLADLPTDDRARGETVRRALRAELVLFSEDDMVLSLDQATGELRVHRLLARTALDVVRLQSLLQGLIDGVERRRAALGVRSSAPPVAPMIIRP